MPYRHGWVGSPGAAPVAAQAHAARTSPSTGGPMPCCAQRATDPAQSYVRNRPLQSPPPGSSPPAACLHVRQMAGSNGDSPPTGSASKPGLLVIFQRISHVLQPQLGPLGRGHGAGTTCHPFCSGAAPLPTPQGSGGAPGVPPRRGKAPAWWLHRRASAEETLSQPTHPCKPPYSRGGARMVRWAPKLSIGPPH